jgi:hypothetical protein
VEKKTRRTFANFSEPLLSLRKWYLVLNFWRERRSSWSLILLMSILNMNISCIYDLSSYFCWLCFCRLCRRPCFLNVSLTLPTIHTLQYSLGWLLFLDVCKFLLSLFIWVLSMPLQWHRIRKCLVRSTETTYQRSKCKRASH